MFGFLAPQHSLPQWRQSYARICQHHRKLFGLTALPFLSYEAVFLYQLAIDSKRIPELPETAPTCCRLRRLAKADANIVPVAENFVAALGMLLAGVKLQDDVEDSGRWFHRLARYKYRKQVQHAHALLDQAAPGIMADISAAIAKHNATERAGREVSLVRYAEATGDGFAAVFGAFAKIVDGPADEYAQVGRHVGRAIIAWDSAVDFAGDQIRGHFNPLRHETDVRDAFDQCALELSRLGWLLPEDSVSAQVVADVIRRVRERRDQRRVSGAVPLLERWGLIRSRKSQYAGCDGCEAVCALTHCGECLGGLGEGATGCCAATGHGGGCCLDGAICCPFECCFGPWYSKKATEKSSGPADSRSSPYARYVNEGGITCGDLNPAGYVRIDGNRIPARTSSGQFLPSDAVVRIVTADAFGVTVVPAEEDGDNDLGGA